MKQIALAAYLSFAPLPALAYEVTTVCATYLNTGASYEVEAVIALGDEINELWDTNSFSFLKKYVIIYWADEQFSVIALDFSMGPSIVGTNGTDQRGYPWQVSRSSLCF